MDTPYDGDVVLTASSGIVFLLANSSYGFSYLFTATSDNQTNKVLTCAVCAGIL